MKKFLSIRELVEPITGGFWGENVVPGSGNARVVRNGDILESGEIGPKVPERLLSEKELQKAKLKKGDVLITMSGNVGRVARVTEEVDPNGNHFVASNFVKILRTKNDILPAYLFFFLRSPLFKKEIRKYTRGVAIQNMSTKVFDQEFIPNISTKEQERVVELLEEAEKLKKKRAEADKKMTTVIPALFNKMFGDPSSYYDSFDMATIRDVTSTVTSGSTPKGGSRVYLNEGNYFIRSQNILMNKLDFSDIVYINDSTYSQMKRSQVQDGDVLLNITGASIGRVSVIQNLNKKANVNQHVCILRLIREKANPIYVSYFLSSKFGQSEIWRSQSGASRQALNYEQIRNMKIALPSINLQNEFAEKITELLKFKEKQEVSAEHIENLFSSILSKSLS